MTPRAHPSRDFLGRLGSATQLLCAALLAVIASADTEPGFLPRGAVLFLVFGVPGIVGWLGAVRRRPALLIAAGVTSFVGAFIAFSGVTLIFLIPALLFVVGAVQLEATRAPHGASIVAGIARAVAAVAVAAMLVGAGASALLVTDDTCWSEYQGSAARIQPFPYTTGEITLPGDATSVSCSTGVISARGVGLAALLWTGALVVALRSSGRGRDAYVSGSGTHGPTAAPTATNSG